MTILIRTFKINVNKLLFNVNDDYYRVVSHLNNYFSNNNEFELFIINVLTSYLNVLINCLYILINRLRVNININLIINETLFSKTSISILIISITFIVSFKITSLTFLFSLLIKDFNSMLLYNY